MGRGGEKLPIAPWLRLEGTGEPAVPALCDEASARGVPIIGRRRGPAPSSVAVLIAVGLLPFTVLALV